MNPSNELELVSIIVASYNHAEYLRERMDSLVNQTYKNIEILVIDDCSTDGSIEILRQYKSNKKVSLIERETNGGWVAVSNQGVELAKGEFIIFANCDDVCAPEIIESLVAALKNNPTAGISFCRSMLIDSHGNSLGFDFDQRENEFRLRCSDNVLLSDSEMAKFLLHSCVIPNLSAALFRKDVYLSCGGLKNQYRVCADWELFFNMAKKFNFYYVSRPLNYFRQHEASIRSSTKERLYLVEIFEIIEKNLYLQKKNFHQNLRYRLHLMYLLAEYTLRPSIARFINLPYLIIAIWRLDWRLIILLPLAFLLRCLEIAGKLFKRVAHGNW